MTTRILTGTKHEIAAQMARIDGDVREAIVFVDEPPSTGGFVEDIFVEMGPYTVRQADVDDSRDAIYRRATGE